MKLGTIASVIIVSSLSFSAQALQINMQPGLWEITSKADPKAFSEQQKAMTESMKKMMEEMQAKMTPEQRQQYAALMANGGANAKTTPRPNTSSMTPEAQESLTQLGNYLSTGVMVNKTCITQKDIDSANFSTQKKQDQCVSTLSQLTSSNYKSVTECKGSSPSHTEVDYNLVNPKTFVGTIVSTTTTNEKSQIIHAEQSGRWLAAECGTYAHNNDDSEEDEVPDMSEEPQAAENGNTAKNKLTQKKKSH